MSLEHLEVLEFLVSLMLLAGGWVMGYAYAMLYLYRVKNGHGLRAVGWFLDGFAFSRSTRVAHNEMEGRIDAEAAAERELERGDE